MNITESRGRLVKKLLGKKHFSQKEILSALKNHEEVVVSETGLATEFLKHNNPIVQKRLETLENLVANMHGMYLSDVNPATHDQKDLENHTVQLDVEETLGIKLTTKQQKDEKTES